MTLRITNSEPLLLNVKDAARLLAVSEFTVRRAVWRGDLRSVRIGRALRIRMDDLKEFIDANAERSGEASRRK